MIQNDDPFYVPDQLSKQIEEESNCRRMQKNRLINEQREFYQEYLKRKDKNKKDDLPCFKIGQENPLHRRQHRTVDELNNNICTNLTKDNIYTQQRMIDQVTYNKRHERENRNYNIINMAPSSGINQQQYKTRIVDGCNIAQYGEFSDQITEGKDRAIEKGYNNQYTNMKDQYPQEEKRYNKDNNSSGKGIGNENNELGYNNISRGLIASQYDIEDNSKPIMLTEEERKKYMAYLEYLKQKEMKMKQMSSNNNDYQSKLYSDTLNQDNQKGINSNPQYIEPVYGNQRELIKHNEKQQNHLNNQSSIPINHYHEDTVSQFNQNPNAKRIETPYVENYLKINNYYQNQIPIQAYAQPKPPYGTEIDSNDQQSSKQIATEKELIEQKKKLDLQEEARREYLSNKMKNVSTYTNLTHMTSLNPSLKCQPIQAPNQLASTKPSSEKIKQQQYKQDLDDQLQLRQHIAPEDKLTNPCMIYIMI